MISTLNTEALGKKIIFYREKANISQTELAKRTGIPQPSMSSIEHGYLKTFPITKLNKIATILNVTLDDLLIDSLDKFKKTTKPKSLYELKFKEMIPSLNAKQLEYFNLFFRYKYEKTENSLLDKC